MTGKTTPTLVTRDWLSGHLEERIASGDLPAGTKLESERELAERYRVSRPVVREVLRGLADRRLVEVAPGRGTYVRRMRATDAAAPLDLAFRRNKVTPRQLTEAREMLECEAAARAAERAQPDDLAAIRWALEQFEQQGGPVERVRYDLAFHMAIANAAHNPVVATMFGSISTLVAELMFRSLADPTVSRVGLPYHTDVYEAIRDRDPERARAAMAGHLEVAERYYGQDFDRSLDSVARRQLRGLLGPEETLEEFLAIALPVPHPGAEGGHE